MTVRLAFADFQTGGSHSRWQIFHCNVDLAIEAIPALHGDFKRARIADTQRHRFGKRSAVAIAQRHVDGPRGEGEVRRGLTHDETIDVVRVGARAAEEIAHLQAIGAVFLDLELAHHIRRTSVVGRAVIRVAVARRLHRRCDVVQLGHVGELAVLHLLHEHKGIGVESETLAGDLHPPRLAFFGRELKGIDIRSGVESTRNVARQRDLLRVLVVRLGFFG